MRIVIHSEPAGIHAHFSFFSGHKYFLRFGKGIVELHTDENREELEKRGVFDELF